MRRFVTLPLLILAVFTVTPGGLSGQPKGEPEVKATVYILDPTSKKEIGIDGVVTEESAGGIKLKILKEDRVIPALEIRQVTYTTKANAADFRKGLNSETAAQKPGLKTEERLEKYSDALRDFKKIAPDIKDVPQAQRYIAFKIAAVQAAIGTLDKTKMDAGIKALEDFRNEHGRGWELIPALKLLADLREFNGDLPAAGKLYEEIATLPDAPADLKNQAQLLEANMLIRAEKFKDAETKLTSARARLLPNDPQRGQITIFISQAKMKQNKLDGVDKELATALATTSDPLLLAVGHNCMGDFYLAKKEPTDAFWAYFRVHMMHSQDRNEHARALYHLSKLFDEVEKDPIRAQEMLDKLLTEKDYAGTSWEKRAREEAGKKPAPR